MSHVKSSLWSLIKSIHLHHNAEFILCPEGICQVFHSVYLINSVQSWFEERQQRYHPGPVPPVHHLWNIRYKTSGTESIVDVNETFGVWICLHTWNIIMERKQKHISSKCGEMLKSTTTNNNGSHNVLWAEVFKNVSWVFYLNRNLEPDPYS